MDKVTMQLQDRIRAQDVMRWGIVSTTRDQSVAEHSFNVTLLVREIAKLLHMNDQSMVFMALDHDLSEVIIGDIPTPTKERFNITDDLVGAFVDIGMTAHHLDPLEQAVLKLADLIDAGYFIHVYGRGHHASVVFQGLQDKIRTQIDTVGMATTENTEVLHVMVDSLFLGEITV